MNIFKKVWAAITYRNNPAYDVDSATGRHYVWRLPAQPDQHWDGAPYDIFDDTDESIEEAYLRGRSDQLDDIMEWYNNDETLMTVFIAQERDLIKGMRAVL